MALTISNTTSTEAGTKTTLKERKAVEILISVVPGRPMSLRMYYGDCEKVTFVPAGGGPTVVTEICRDRAGMIEVTEAEMMAMPVFQSTYLALKALSDAKAAEQWPDLGE
jgi:hypothetical protein